MWLGGWVVGMLDLRSTGRGFESWPPRCQVQPWASCFHTCASITKQYNLVVANGRWCLAAGKVTVGLASHIYALDVSASATSSKLRRGRWAPTMLSSGVSWTLVFYGVFCCKQCSRVCRETSMWSEMLCVLTLCPDIGDKSTVCQHHRQLLI